MLALDTNHLSELDRDSELGRRLRDRLLVADEVAAIPIVCAEELLRGWLAVIHRQTEPAAMLHGYTRLQRNLESFGNWRFFAWSERVGAIYRSLRRQLPRLATMDLKIASIALGHDATLLTRNTKDFAQVPGLKYENWLD